ncbi:hypothetical protein LEP1GSC047_1328 [Leptospira inadai serovar Lyme str. 10]|uniref:Lipoprotein n=2 Tax=Leptospira inadai serovar Lyme TaxID=293084 RepID=V6HGT6_9LEPT|nr:hypothetical protein [Leptospira inadai]EQA34865.1 hypothetical protein LEP1GSC047_1328 [Leptospira inadai serovar Lyme str. 10]PNV76051.1 hypothetical protein BES34_006000 [Leptospira inadai serovar Lyme]
MHSRFITYFLLLSFLPFRFATALIPAKPQKQDKEKTERNRTTKSQEKISCCELDDTSQGDLRLVRICLTKNRTRFTFKYATPSSACTILSNVTFRDASGKIYNPVSSEGIPDCNSQKSRKVEEFIWNFERINPKSKSFDLFEKEVAGLSAWSWREINLEKCNFE